MHNRKRHQSCPHDAIIIMSNDGTVVLYFVGPIRSATMLYMGYL